MQYKLEISNLTKHFGEKTLFEALDLTVTGPVILWAPSGWGKTTLLRILMGLEVPTSGTVTGVGKVGAVFQEDRLCPQLNAIQNVELVLPEEKRNTESRSTTTFYRLDWMKPPSRSRHESCPAGRNAVRPCCGHSGPRATPCCWTSRSPAWTPTP